MQPQSEEKVRAALIRLDEAWSHLSRQISSEIKEYPLAIPRSQVYLLRLLDRRGALSMSDLAGSLGITMSGCTAQVDRLADAGWVERRRSFTDRRVVLVDVSPAGRQMLAEIRETRARILARYLTRLNADEILMLTSLLERTAEAIAPESVVTS